MSGLSDAWIEKPTVSLDSRRVLTIWRLDEQRNKVTLQLLFDKSEHEVRSTVLTVVIVIRLRDLDREWIRTSLEAGELRVFHGQLLEQLAEDRLSYEVGVIFLCQFPEICSLLALNLE